MNTGDTRISNGTPTLSSQEECKVTVKKGRQSSLAWRHFKTLTRKNLINYKRTPIGSSLEILIPVFLMGLLCVMRWLFPPISVSNFDIYDLKKPFYPVVSLDPNTGNWTNNNFDNTELGLELR
jgi:hypothetical protein